MFGAQTYNRLTGAPCWSSRASRVSIPIASEAGWAPPTTDDMIQDQRAANFSSRGCLKGVARMGGMPKPDEFGCRHDPHAIEHGGAALGHATRR